MKMHENFYCNVNKQELLTSEKKSEKQERKILRRALDLCVFTALLLDIMHYHLALPLRRARLSDGQERRSDRHHIFGSVA